MGKVSNTFYRGRGLTLVRYIGLNNTRLLELTKATVDKTTIEQAGIRRETAHCLMGIDKSIKRIECSRDNSIGHVQNSLNESRAQGSADHIETIAHLDRIEQRICDTQRRPFHSIRKSEKLHRRSPALTVSIRHRKLNNTRSLDTHGIGKRPSDTHVAKIPDHHLVRVIRPGILTFESSGIISQVLLPLEDPKYRACSFTEKITLVKQLQDIRLAIWLLRHNRVRYCMVTTYQSPDTSAIILQGNLFRCYCRRWVIANSIIPVRPYQCEDSYLISRCLYYISALSVTWLEQLNEFRDLISGRTISGEFNVEKHTKQGFQCIW